MDGNDNSKFGRLVTIRVYEKDLKVLKMFCAAESVSIPRGFHAVLRRTLPGMIDQLEAYTEALRKADADDAPAKKRVRKLTR